MKGLIYMRNNKVAVRKVDQKNELHEKLRRELVNSVAEELIEDPNMFLLFANIAIQETPWEVVKDKYFFVLPESLFFLEGMWPHVDRDSIIPDVQVALQDFGCKKIASKAMREKYTEKEVAFTLLFSSKEDFDVEDPESYGFSRENANAANRMLQISKIFDVVNSWPTTKDYSQKQKIRIVTKMVNKLITF